MGKYMVQLMTPNNFYLIRPDIPKPGSTQGCGKKHERNVKGRHKIYKLDKKEIHCKVEWETYLQDKLRSH